MQTVLLLHGSANPGLIAKYMRALHAEGIRAVTYQQHDSSDWRTGLFDHVSRAEVVVILLTTPEDEQELTEPIALTRGAITARGIPVIPILLGQLPHPSAAEGYQVFVEPTANPMRAAQLTARVVRALREVPATTRRDEDDAKASAAGSPTKPAAPPEGTAPSTDVEVSTTEARNLPPSDDTESLAAPTGARKRHLVVLIHGIRTQAEWAYRVRDLLEGSDPMIVVVPARYEYLDLLRFLVPLKITRQPPIDRVTAKVRASIAKHKPERISLISHSFGTFITGQILDQAPELHFHRIILCGSILPDDYRWDKVSSQLGEDRWAVINDCGLRDPLPVFAKCLTWGFGSSGRFGFGDPHVRDRAHYARHSDFFSTAFVTKHWIPYLTTGQISSGETNIPKAPGWLNALTLVKVPLIVGVMMCLAATYALMHHLW